MPVGATAGLLGARAMPVATAAAPVTTFGGAVVNINLPAGVNGHDVIDAVKRYNRRNGTAGWVVR
jgi:hypothetical protein